ncbi:MAG: hypothetical protein M0010_02490 [Actinomycetota bacterium]|nr:hypothetical protein [Actinomycetota bacterium]
MKVIGVMDWPAMTVAEVEGSEIDGGAVTVKVKDWVAFGLKPLLAVTVIGKAPSWAGVPERVPALDRLTPEGRLPDSLKVGVGVPVAVKV